MLFTQMKAKHVLLGAVSVSKVNWDLELIQFKVGVYIYHM